MTRTWFAVVLSVLAGVAVACADNGTSSTDGSGGTGTGAAATTSSGTAGSGGGDDCPKSEAPTLSPGNGCVQVGTVSGQVLDQDGNPPSETTITICGDACMFGDLAADGTFSMTVDHCYSTSPFYGVPVMIYHGWPAYADVTVKFVPDGVTDVPTADVGVITTVATDTMKSFNYSDPVATTISDDNGFSIEVADCQLELPAFQEDIYVGEVALDDFPLPDAPAELLALYFVAPDNSYFTAPAAVRFPNAAQLPAGAAVELMALGNMGTTTLIEAGTFDVVGTGRVSDDGSHVESDPALDSGLTTLGWIGYREAQ